MKENNSSFQYSLHSDGGLPSASNQNNDNKSKGAHFVSCLAILARMSRKVIMELKMGLSSKE